MLQSKMSAEEEDAVQSELADLEKQLVSNSSPSIAVTTSDIHPQGLVKEPAVHLPDAPRTELPTVEHTGQPLLQLRPAHKLIAQPS